MDVEAVLRTKRQLEQQRKVISKKVLQNILEKRTPCNNEIVSIQETDRMLQESLLECKKARSYLSCARKNLTTTNLQILATYKKREVLQQILATLQKLKKLKSTEIQLQKLLDMNNYSGAIHLVLECKRLAEENRQFVCVEALSQKLQDTLEQVDVQLENVLREVRIARYLKYTFQFSIYDYQFSDSAQFRCEELFQFARGFQIAGQANDRPSALEFHFDHSYVGLQCFAGACRTKSR